MIDKPSKTQAQAFLVHILTASGAFLALLSIIAASDSRWTDMWWWLGLALFVDGIDGPIARKVDVKGKLPNWSGDMLDSVIDYMTYVLIPAFALYQRGLVGGWLAFVAAGVIVVTSAIYYADTRMKTKENFFKGFPVAWNMLVFVLFVLMPPSWLNFIIVCAAGALTFAPIQFLHPVRVVRLRPLNLTVCALWCFAGVMALLWALTPPFWVELLLVASSLYLFCIGAVMQWRAKLGKT